VAESAIFTRRNLVRLVTWLAVLTPAAWGFLTFVKRSRDLFH
jgi:hypothetical protein